MRTRAWMVASTLLVLATSASAGSKVQMNLIPSPPDCFAGPAFCLNVGANCPGGDNSECALATVSARSKVKLDGKLALKAKIKDVTDATGALMTTGPLESTDGNVVLLVGISSCPVDTGAPPICDDPTNIYLKVVLTDGDGSLKLDLAPVLSLAVGTTVAVLRIALLDPPAGGNCVGDNSTAAITARLNDANCDIGIIRAVGGIVTQ